MSEKPAFHTRSYGAEKMSQRIASEMQFLVRDSAGPIEGGLNIKGQMQRAWAALGYPREWLIKAAWYGEAGAWSAAKVDEFRERYRAAKAADRTRDASRTAIQIARAEAQAQALERIDAELFSEKINRLRSAARRMGNDPP